MADSYAADALDALSLRVKINMKVDIGHLTAFLATRDVKVLQRAHHRCRY
jgi:hypothetical protein